MIKMHRKMYILFQLCKKRSQKCAGGQYTPFLYIVAVPIFLKFACDVSVFSGPLVTISVWTKNKND